jgi:hypothetical protein
MCASSSCVRAESIDISVGRIGYEFVTVDHRGEAIQIQYGAVMFNRDGDVM